MQVIADGGLFPFVYTTHHAECDFGSFAPRVGLTKEQRIRFSDYGTDATVPRNGMIRVSGTRSRGLVDLNRPPDHPNRFPTHDFARPKPNKIWLPGMEPTAAEQQLIHETYYVPFHNAVLEMLLAGTPLTKTMVIAWDNTADYEIGNNEAGEPVHMPAVILSNRGAEGRADSDEGPVTCSPGFLELLAENLRAMLAAAGLPNQVFLNLVFKGGYVASRYSMLYNEAELRGLGVPGGVQSFQVEYNTAITHDQATLEPNPQNMVALREVFEYAIAASFSQYFAFNGF